MQQSAPERTWPIGGFDMGEQLRRGRKFEDLSLTPGEREALKDIERLYRFYISEEMERTGKHNGMGMTKEIMLERLRGMKITFDHMKLTEDALRESMMWQSRFY